MKRISTFSLVILAGTLVAALLAACSGTASPESANPTSGGYAGALDLSYEGALDVPTQLALGTLKLEGTADAFSEDQAADLLPLWQAFAGDAFKGEKERAAILAQIESSMQEGQVAAIAGMQLTAEDLRAWAQTQGGGTAPGGQAQRGQQRPGGGGQGGGGQGGAGAQMSDEARATRRAEFQNMSEEERATRIAQFRQGGAAGGGAPQGLAASGPLAAVVALLSERAGVATPPAVARQRPVHTPTAAATSTSAPAEMPTAPPTPTQAVEPTQTVTVVPPVTPTPAEPEPEPRATPTVASSVVQPPAAAPASYQSPGLVRRPDSDPGPPLAVEVSANRAYPDPLVEQSRTYHVSGIVRNDGSEHYALSALHITFFDADGFRGSYRRFPGPYNMGGEWIWHGKTEADVACLLLAPGEECPFVVDITAQDMAFFLIHPDAGVTGRQSAPLEASAVRLAHNATEYVTLSGSVTNTHSFKVKNLILSGVLLDAAGEIVGLGSTYVIEEDIEPGQVVDFKVRIHDSAHSVGTPFVEYQVYAQAERDWD